MKNETTEILEENVNGTEADGYLLSFFKPHPQKYNNDFSFMLTAQKIGVGRTFKIIVPLVTRR